MNIWCMVNWTGYSHPALFVFYTYKVQTFSTTLLLFFLRKQYSTIDDTNIAIYSLMQRHFYLHSQAIYMKKRTFLQRRNMWFWDLLLTWIPQVRTTAIANPTPNPSPVKRNNTRSTDFVSEWCGSTYGVVLLHALDTWNPHRPMLPRNERLVNVKKWGESGILPTSSL